MTRMNASAPAPPTWLQRTRLGIASLRLWPPRRWMAAITITLLAGLAIGIPTGIVHTSFYSRMTPVTWWDYPVWATSAVLVGLTAATYVRSAGRRADVERPARTIGAALLSSFAVGCPICNKLIVALIGVSGALSYWAPLQPVLGVLSIALLATGLAVRLQGDAACRAPLR